MTNRLVNSKEYGAKRRGRGPYHGRGALGNDLIQVYNETKVYCRSYETQLAEAESWTDIPEPAAITSIETASNQSTNDKSIKTTPSCEVLVVSSDTLSAVEADESDLILIMGSDYKEGGGVKSGASAQEENVYRRTNIHMVSTSQFYTHRLQSLIYFPTLELLVLLKDDKCGLVGKNSSAFKNHHDYTGGD